MENLYTTDINLLTRTGKTVIEFYGNGCLNCQIMTPILNKLEQVMSDIKFYRINVDMYHDLAQKYQITSIPSLVLFRDGKKLSTIVGVKPQLTLQMIIQDVLNYA